MTNYSEKDVISFVSENDVQFIRLAFVDLFGNLKNLAIMPSELKKALTNGIPLDSSLFYGTDDYSHGDIYLVPDTSTLSVLPWRPRAGRVVRFFCHLRKHDGTPFKGDIRARLKNTADQLSMNGYTCTIGTESQFYLFELDENGEPTRKTNDRAGYLDVAPLDHGENIRREICLSLDEMGIHPETSRHLHGHGQNEITFKPSDILSAADNTLNFKTAVRSIASQNGLYASFMPYPLRDQPRSSFLINISINRGGKNIFAVTDGKIEDEGRHFIAGILSRFDQMTAFLNPTTNSYFRNGLIGEHKYINWAMERRDAAIRLINSATSGEKIEIRTADPSANVHFILNTILRAGLEGLENKLELPEPSSESQPIPGSLEEAANIARESDFIRKMFSEFGYEKNFQSIDSTVKKYNDAKDKAQFEDQTYF
ncbi:MAG: glutamine synthetase family protein [Oscillospiraceae bacterium]|nr:glutamine synthetase family protein [Oscillospiraceae bacterium]